MIIKLYKTHNHIQFQIQKKVMRNQQQNSQMQLQNQSGSIEANPLTNLQKFLSNYNNFIEQNTTLQLNTQTILDDIALNILKPPSAGQNQELQNLYETGKNLPKILSRASSQSYEVYSSLKKLKQDKIYDTILMIQQLNHKLNKDYEEEVNRGIQNGVYNRKTTGQIISSKLQTSSSKEQFNPKNDPFTARHQKLSEQSNKIYSPIHKPETL